MELARAEKKLPFRPIARETVHDRVYEGLKEMILDGGIEPGQTVTIQSLAQAFDVSAMPVREALRRLTAEKALTVIAGRSVGIPALSGDRLADLTRVRREVEGLAAEWAATRLSEAGLARLDALVEQMTEAAAAKDRKSFVPANREFHFTVYGAAGSPTLLGVIESLWLQVGPYFDLLRASDNWRTANIQHRAMLKALASRDPAGARAALDADIAAAATILLRLLDGG